MKGNNYNKKEDNLAAIGIGAMIVFIALVLVAAVASAVIIQTGEKLQQNAQQTGSDTQREIGGKITIVNVVVASTDNFRLYFESSPGSDVLDETGINWQITCQNANGANAGYQYLTGTFAAAAHVSDGTALGATENIDPGVSYYLTIDAEDGGGAQCHPDNAAGNGLDVNGEATLWIHVNGGGSTYESLYISDLSPGAAVI